MQINLQKAVDYVTVNGFSTSISYNYQKTPAVIPTDSDFTGIIEGYKSSILGSFDPEYGGFGQGQKFPQGRTMDYALGLYEQTKDKQWLDIVQKTLENQYTKISEIKSAYRLFDPIEGGFHRYSTQKNGTVPHYEKMLYDNARLLLAYAHLQNLAPSKEAKDVVTKTLSYIADNWYDAIGGGFYGNTDVGTHEKYYGEVKRPAERPRVEKTKFTDWNSEAVITYLALWRQTKNPDYKTIATRTLDFFASEMLTDDGMYHYQKEDGSKGVRGSLLDNSYALLGFVDGYETLGDQKYLDAAKKIAGYSLEHLYDWNSGGFFERNSPDATLYAPGQTVLLRKPTDENGIMSDALLRLFKVTNNPLYLNAGIKTLGTIEGNAGGLDDAYYTIKAAEFTRDNQLLSAFEQERSQIEQIQQEKQSSFWLNGLLGEKNQVAAAAPFQPSAEGVPDAQTPFLLLLLIAFLAGILSFASPCCLPVIPAFIASTFSSTKQSVKGMTLAFVSGMGLTFALLGMTAFFVGTFLKAHLTGFSQIMGIIIMLFGIYTLAGKGLKILKPLQSKPTSYGGAFLFGGALGIVRTPCIGPVLVTVFLLASTSASVLQGGLLLLTYSLGLAVPFLLLAWCIGRFDKQSLIWRVIRGKELTWNMFGWKGSIHTTNLISGLLFLSLGYLIFSGTLYSLSRYAVGTGFQKWLFGLEGWLLHFIR
jgi:cytochrome c-type biogenesis protein